MKRAALLSVSAAFVVSAPAAAQYASGDKILCSKNKFAEPEMRGLYLLGKAAGGLEVTFNYQLKPRPGVAKAPIADVANFNWFQLSWSGPFDPATGKMTLRPIGFQAFLSGADPLLGPVKTLTLEVIMGTKRFGPFPASYVAHEYNKAFAASETIDPKTMAPKTTPEKLAPLFAALEKTPAATIVLLQTGKEVGRLPVSAPALSVGRERARQWAIASAKIQSGGACAP